ncbi:hypothetical protein BJ878DRAFT_158686 [Calycina marina]|uniref:Uncharacterized protein n=1 Tax=Calycina marina TaxID=1763456 RepID=A0A9P7YZH7_9HELO|nr:hypothetical protein BJ878DRAFT_158686 [Calycina marina]
MRKVFELRAEREVDVLIMPCMPAVAKPHPPMHDEHGQQTTMHEKNPPTGGVSFDLCPFNVTVILLYDLRVMAKRWDEEMILEAAAVLEEGKRMYKKTSKITLKLQDLLRKEEMADTFQSSCVVIEFAAEVSQGGY